MRRIMSTAQPIAQWGQMFSQIGLKCQYWSKHVQTCSNMSKIVQTYSNLNSSELVQT